MAIIIIRTLVVYFALVVSMRLMGKRQLSELELPELAIAVLIADLAAHPLQDIGIPLMNGLLPIVVLCCCEPVSYTHLHIFAPNQRLAHSLNHVHRRHRHRIDLGRIDLRGTVQNSIVTVIRCGIKQHIQAIYNALR